MTCRIFKRQKCGIEYDRGLNACINIAHRVMSSVGWGSSEPLEPADEAGGAKPQLNAGSSLLKQGEAHEKKRECLKKMQTGHSDSHTIAKENLKNRIAGEIIFSPSPGEALKKWRTLFNISQSELARAMEISSSVLSDYENNRRKSPGTVFIRRYVNALIEIDSKKGGANIRRFSNTTRDLSNVILAIAELTRPRTADEMCSVIDGVWLAGRGSANSPIFGYTVIDSLQAIRNLDSHDFLYLFGQNSMRLVVFTNVSRGRSPMIAVKIYPIKPKMIAIHGPRSAEEVDRLGIELAESEGIPYVLSLKKSVKGIIDSLSRL